VNNVVTKTVLITGAAAGIGQATAHAFRQRGWQVAATMRRPQVSDQANVIHPYLDVLEPESITAAVKQTLDTFGPIDVVVNNAGYGLVGPFEATTPEQVEQQFGTNVLGLMAVTRAVLPSMRQRRQGCIVNISSIGGRLTLPLFSLYHSSKWAVEGFSESLQYELRAFNIRVKLIEPGPIQTEFYGRSADFGDTSQWPDYDALMQRVSPRLKQMGSDGSPPEVTAEVIYRAATDGFWRLRYPAGGNASVLLGLRKLLPDAIFFAMIRRIMA